MSLSSMRSNEAVYEGCELLQSDISKSLSFFTLPCEVRLEIYKHLFSNFRIHYHYSSRHCGEPVKFLKWPSNVMRIRTQIFTSIVYTNKQISREALEVLHHSLQVHVKVEVTMLTQHLTCSAEDMARQGLPQHVRQQLRHLTYWPGRESHSQLGRYGGYVPDSPFPFSETPNLEQFIIRQTLDLDFAKMLKKAKNKPTADDEKLPVPGRYEPISGCTKTCSAVTKYKTLTTNEKFALWQRAGLMDSVSLLTSIKTLNQKNWLSQLILPHLYGGVSRESEPCAVLADSPLEQVGSNDGKSATSSIITDPTPRLAVPRSCAIIVEVEIVINHLIDRGDLTDADEDFEYWAWGLHYDEDLIDKFVVAIDTRRQEVLNKRFLRGDHLA